MKALTAFLILSLFYLKTSAQKWIWASTIASNPVLEQDRYGNNYLATRTSASPLVSILAKRNAAGDTLWSRRFSCNIFDIKTGINHIYITGTFRDSVILGEKTFISPGNQSFVASYDLSGRFVWGRISKGKGENLVRSMDLNEKEEIYIIGTNSDTIQFAKQLSVPGTFISIFDKNGTTQSIFHVSNKIVAARIRVDHEDNIHFTCGVHSYLTPFYIGSDTLTGTHYYGSYYLVKMNKLGTTLWVKGLGSQFRANVGVCEISTEGEVYFVTTYVYSHGILTKISSSGEVIWTKEIGSNIYLNVNDLRADNDNNLYLTGTAWVSATFGCGTVSGMDGNFMYAAKLDSAGNCHWLKYATGITGRKISPGDTVIFVGSGVSALDSIPVNGYFIAGLTQPKQFSCDTFQLTSSEDKTTYLGYDPMKCTTINTKASGGKEPYIYSWTTGDTTSSVNICPLETTTYTVNVTDAYKCSLTDTIVVHVMDVRCANNKVLICHHLNKTICVSPSAVQAHLRKGYKLGNCSDYPYQALEEKKELEERAIKVYPNPGTGNFLIEVCKDEKVNDARIQVINSMGQIIYNREPFLIEGCIQETVELNSNLPEGIYFLNLISGSNIETKRIILSKKNSDRLY